MTHDFAVCQLECHRLVLREVHAVGLHAWQVQGPLTALRTLGSILVPRLRQKEGQEIDRDVAQGILTQACASPYIAAHMIAFSQVPVQET